MKKQRNADLNKQRSSRPETPKVIRAVSDQTRNAMIAEAAYLRAEQRGFQGDASLDDWLLSEADVNARLSSRE